MEAQNVAGTPSRIDKAIKIVALLLGLNVVAFGAYYYLEQYHQSSPALVDLGVQQLESLVRADPNNVGTRLQVAAGYNDLGKYDDAIEQYQAALQLRPQNQEALFGLAKVYMTTRQYEQAFPLFQKLADLHKDNPNRTILETMNTINHNLAVLHLHRGEADAAIARLKEALAINPVDADSLYQLGNAHKMQGSLTEAVAAYREAVRYDYNFAEAYEGLAATLELQQKGAEATHARGMALFGRRQYANAVQELTRATTQAPDFAEAHAGLGMTYERLAQRDKAEAAYREAVRLDPEQALARQGLNRLGLVP